MREPEVDQVVRREVTLADVAQASGVHPSTVSRALDAEASTKVKPATRQRVLAAAEELGYRPDRLASGLRRGRTNTVGVIVPDLGNAFWATVLRGLTDVLDTKGYVGYVAESRDESVRLERMIESFLAHKVDLVIVGAARREDRALLRGLARSGVKVLLVVRDLPRSGLPVVCHDDLAGGRLAAEHLYSLGHRRVTQLRGPDAVSSFVDRARGFSMAVEELGMEEIVLDAEAVEATHGQGVALMRKLHVAVGGVIPTGVFAHNDLLALGAVSVLHAEGFRVPTDVSVIGYDDVPLMRHVAPALTTIRLPGEEIGRLAGERALRLVSNESIDRVRVGAELVVRDSTAPPDSLR